MSEPSARPQISLGAINMDCADAPEMADFYGRLLGYVVVWQDEDFIVMQHPDGGTSISFQEEAWYAPPVWPEREGELTKMMHLDIRVDDLEAAVAHALAAGGRLAEHQPREDLRIILDPAGHPLCLCTD